MPRKLKAPLISSDPYFLHAGDGIKLVSDYQPDATHLTFDSGTGVWDGLVGAFKTPSPYVTDGMSFDNSQHTATFEGHILDYNGDRVNDTEIAMLVGGVFAGAFVVLSHTDVLVSDLFGG